MTRAKPQRSVLIIGAGIAGLMAACSLRSEHSSCAIAVTLLDKGRGVGGRLATRRIGSGVFDHGAQFFTARDPAFAKLVREWEAAGVVREWCRGFAGDDGVARPDGPSRYRGEKGMTDIAKYLAAKHLAQNQPLHLGIRVESVSQENGGWVARTEGGAEFTGDALLLTAPVPQSLALLKAGDVALPTDARDALETVTYDPCIALLVLMPGSSGSTSGSDVPPPGAVQQRSEDPEPIYWIADNQQKGISPNAVAITIHAGPEFSRRYAEVDDGGVAEELLKAAGRWIRGPVEAVQVKRWRYAKPTRTLPDRCLFVDRPLSSPLAFAGDAFAGPRVEGAALSGMAAAKRLADALLGE